MSSKGTAMYAFCTRMTAQCVLASPAERGSQDLTKVAAKITQIRKACSFFSHEKLASSSKASSVSVRSWRFGLLAQSGSSASKAVEAGRNANKEIAPATGRGCVRGFWPRRLPCGVEYIAQNICSRKDSRGKHPRARGSNTYTSMLACAKTQGPLPGARPHARESHTCARAPFDFSEGVHARPILAVCALCAQVWGSESACALVSCARACRRTDRMAASLASAASSAPERPLDAVAMRAS
eukprot:6183243-Pleurochrysis_carterae.AAC.2